MVLYAYSQRILAAPLSTWPVKVGRAELLDKAYGAMTGQVWARQQVLLSERFVTLRRPHPRPRISGARMRHMPFVLQTVFAV